MPDKTTYLPLIFLCGSVLLICFSPKGRFYERLKEWQSGLGAAFGLVVASLVATWTAGQSQDMWTRQQQSESYQVARSLLAEIDVLYDPLIDLAGITALNRNSVAVAATNPENRYCLYLQRRSFEWLTLSDLGLFEANKSNVGKLPGNLGAEFSRFHLDWRELRRLRDAVQKEACNAVTVQQFDRMTELSVKLTNRIKPLKEQIDALPGRQLETNQPRR